MKYSLTTTFDADGMCTYTLRAGDEYVCASFAPDTLRRLRGPQLAQAIGRELGEAVKLLNEAVPA